jgi:hypothetical protein
MPTLARLDTRIAGVPSIPCSPDGRMLAGRAAWLRAMRCDVLVEPFTAATLLAKVEEALTVVVSWRGHDRLQRAAAPGWDVTAKWGGAVPIGL